MLSKLDPQTHSKLLHLSSCGRYVAIQNPPREYADLRWTYISLASNWLDRS